MIPGFNDEGYLPAGIHEATLEEVTARFGQASEIRRVQIDSIGWLLDLARRVGGERLIINGSFTTDVLEPNDVDVVLLVGSGFPRDAETEAELREGLPFIDLHVVGADDFDYFVNRVFGTDRFSNPKGVVEIAL
jgi:hypothetical protein